MNESVSLPNTALSMAEHITASDPGPTLEPLFTAKEVDDQSSHAYRQLIGGLGFALPYMLWLMAGLRPTEGLQRWEMLGSLSAYYHTGAVPAFVGILVALGVFLITYRGYNNKYRRRDRAAAIMAGTAAILVAFFPTAAPKGLSGPSWWAPRTGVIHYVAAVVLFSAFSFISLFLFRKTKVGAGEPLPADKRVRNGIYSWCGIAMVGCMAWAGGASVVGASILWPEALALEFFAISWLVKGRADRTAVAAARRTWHYGRHPRQLASDLLAAIRR